MWAIGQDLNLCCCDQVRFVPMDTKDLNPLCCCDQMCELEASRANICARAYDVIWCIMTLTNGSTSFGKILCVTWQETFELSLLKCRGAGDASTLYSIRRRRWLVNPWTWLLYRHAWMPGKDTAVQAALSRTCMIVPSGHANMLHWIMHAITWHMCTDGKQIWSQHSCACRGCLEVRHLSKKQGEHVGMPWWLVCTKL